MPAQAREGGVSMISAVERRMNIVDILLIHRHVNIDKLSFEFNVSKRTIIRDIQILSYSFPIYTTQGIGGGVHIEDGYRLGMKYLTEEQASLLEKISHNLVGEDLNTMNCILKTFKRPDHDSKRYG